MDYGEGAPLHKTPKTLTETIECNFDPLLCAEDDKYQPYLVCYFDENFEGYLKKPNKRKEDAFIEIIKNSNILLHVHSFGVRLIEWSNGVGLENIQTLGL